MSSNKSHKKTSKVAECNTSNSAQKETRSQFFTLNNWTEDEKDDLLSWFKGRKGLSYMMQEETGANGGQPHLQGVWKCTSPVKWDYLKKKFPRVHWEKTRSWDYAVEYCCKSETRSGEVYHSDDIKVNYKRTVVDPLNGLKLYPYQKKVLSILKRKPHDRRIYWFWDEDGNIGKSALVKHIYLKNKDVTIIGNGKGNDVRNQVNMHLNGDGKNNKYGKDLTIAILDFPRTIEEYVSYEVIEQIKNGFLYSGKYEGGVCCFNTPHVICFANFGPNRNSLSKDRWRIYKIDKDGEYELETEEPIE